MKLFHKYEFVDRDRETVRDRNKWTVKAKTEEKSTTEAGRQTDEDKTDRYTNRQTGSQLPVEKTTE